jgi:hypothetical protein
MILLTIMVLRYAYDHYNGHIGQLDMSQLERAERMFTTQRGSGASP